MVSLFVYRSLWWYIERGGKSEYNIIGNSVRRLSWTLYRGLIIFENGNNNNNNNTVHFNICTGMGVKRQ